MATRISPPDEKLLRTLWTRGPLTAVRAGADAFVVRRLSDQGLLTEVTGSAKGQLRLELTERGCEVAADLPPANPKTIDLYRELIALREEVRSLRAMLTTAPSAPPMPSTPLEPPDAPTPTSPDLRSELRRTLEQLASSPQWGGLVPLPALRKHLQPLRISRDVLDAALLDAEGAYVIDLKVANDPSVIDDAHEGIMVEGRGLLYFAVPR